MKKKKNKKSQYDFLLKSLKESENYNPFDPKQNPQAKELKKACEWLSKN